MFDRIELNQMKLFECNTMLIETIRNGLAIIHDWCSKNWEVKFRHIQRNVNKVVDCIAKTDGGVIEQLIILEDPPHYVRCWLEEDIRQSSVADDNFH
ncbi:hypothetical protein Gotur_003807 [Gossypium turneri]